MVTPPKDKILCIDDDDTCDLVKCLLEQEGFQVVACSTAQEGIDYIKANNLKLVILDNRLTKTNGIEVCKEIRSFNSHIPILFFSGEARQSEINKALQAGAASTYLVKPLGFEKPAETVIRLLREVNRN